MVCHVFYFATRPTKWNGCSSHESLFFDICNQVLQRHNDICKHVGEVFLQWSLNTRRCVVPWRECEFWYIVSIRVNFHTLVSCAASAVILTFY